MNDGERRKTSRCGDRPHVAHLPVPAAAGTATSLLAVAIFTVPVISQAATAILAVAATLMVTRLFSRSRLSPRPYRLRLRLRLWPLLLLLLLVPLPLPRDDWRREVESAGEADPVGAGVLEYYSSAGRHKRSIGRTGLNSSTERGSSSVTGCNSTGSRTGQNSRRSTGNSSSNSPGSFRAEKCRILP